MKRKKHQESRWVPLGSGLGRVRNPSLARSEKLISRVADHLGDDLKEKLTLNPNLNSHQAMWYAIKSIQATLEAVEEELLNDLWHLGVHTPETFDVLKFPDRPKKRKQK